MKRDTEEIRYQGLFANRLWCSALRRSRPIRGGAPISHVVIRDPSTKSILRHRSTPQLQALLEEVYLTGYLHRSLRLLPLRLNRYLRRLETIPCHSPPTYHIVDNETNKLSLLQSRGFFNLLALAYQRKVLLCIIWGVKMDP